jgi:activator of HSP90 ATPase
MEGNYFITASHDYDVPPKEIYSLIRDGELFRLAGANTVNFTFSEDGPFELLFKSGTVHGRFLKIEENSKIIMEWDSDGFDRSPEPGTKVWVTLLGDEKHTTVALEHREIPTEESALSKKKSWERILEELGGI